MLVRSGGLADVECMRDKCMSGNEAFSASVCLQTKHKMGFTFGYSENVGKQSVLRCLLYLWCGAFLSSTAPSRFFFKACCWIRGVWCPVECNSSYMAAATQPDKNTQ